MLRTGVPSNSKLAAVHNHAASTPLCRRSKEKLARRNSLSSPGSSLIRAKRLAWDAPMQPLPEGELASGVRWDGNNLAIPADTLAVSIAPRADGRDSEDRGAAIFVSLPRSEPTSARRSTETYRRTSQSPGFFRGSLFGGAKDKGVDIAAHRFAGMRARKSSYSLGVVGAVTETVLKPVTVGKSRHAPESPPQPSLLAVSADLVPEF